MFQINKFALILIVLLLVSWLFYDFLQRWYKLLRANVKCDFGVPVLGSHWREILNIESFHETLIRLYYKYPNDRFIVLQGVGGEPEFLIRDPELVRQIAIRDFSCFVNRINDIHASTDPMLGNQLTNLKTDDWRRIRNVITSLMIGQKLKNIVIPSLDENKRELVQFLNSEMAKTNSGELVVDIMDLSLRSIVDAFCLIAFGLKSDSLRNDGNDYGFFECMKSFYKHGETLNRAMYWAIICFPRTMKFCFGKTLMSEKDQSFFTKSCIEIADKRIAQQINRSDYIQLLQTVRDKASDDNKVKDYTSIELISQCFEFYESVVTENNIITTFLIRKLAEHRDIQERLHDEMIQIKNRIGDNGLTYELINDMKYAEMVINEGLRMCPIATELKRRATKPYVLENRNGEKVAVRPDDGVWLPIFILQNDPQYYPNPSIFDPERFNSENQKTHTSGTYAPFGMGPRNCIGCQQPISEIKIMFYHLLLEFKFEQVDANEYNNNFIKIKSRFDELK